MGISGHILGDKKLNRLNKETGFNFDRAYNRNGYGEGRVIDEQGRCVHYNIDFNSMSIELSFSPRHWTSCQFLNSTQSKDL